MRSILGSPAFRAGLAAVLSFAALGAAPAEAQRRGGGRPPVCDTVHDHRAHNADYYDFYAADRFYRAGPYRAARADFRGGRNGYADRGRRANREIVYRDVLPTRGRARIVVTEEIVWRRRGRPDRVCTVAAVGRDADLVPVRRLRRVAETHCSRRAAIRIRA